MSAAFFSTGSTRARMIESERYTSSPGTAIRAEQEHVKRLARDIGVVQDLQDVGTDEAVAAQVARNAEEPSSNAHNAHEQHREHRAENTALDHAALTALAGALGITAHVVCGCKSYAGTPWRAGGPLDRGSFCGSIEYLR